MRLITRAMGRWTPPVGVYVGQEVCGRLVVQLSYQRGWRIPDDVAIIAGKNRETLCQHPRPSLTSVEIGYDRIGYAAAEVLDRMTAGQPPTAEQIRLAPQGLVVRESTDFFAVESPLVAAALAYIAANSHRRIGPGDSVSARPSGCTRYFAASWASAPANTAAACGCKGLHECPCRGTDH